MIKFKSKILRASDSARILIDLAYPKVSLFYFTHCLFFFFCAVFFMMSFWILCWIYQILQDKMPQLASHSTPIPSLKVLYINIGGHVFCYMNLCVEFTITS